MKKRLYLCHPVLKKGSGQVLKNTEKRALKIKKKNF